MVYLPEDLVVKEILPKLPIKSLMRFKCVSKTWFDHIANSSSLASSYLRHHSKTTNLSIILARGIVYENKLRIFEVHDESKVVESDVPDVMQHLELIEIIGSSNGLVCLQHYLFGDAIMLWNPETRECRNLPKAPLCVTSSTSVANLQLSRPSVFALGFGFDDRSEDYKLVRIVQDNETNPWKSVINHVQVFTTSSDSWRVVKQILGFSFHNTGQAGVLFSGALYWLVQKEDLRDRFCFLSFDLRNEEMRIISLPDHVVQINNRSFRLIKWKESLALLSFIYNYDGRVWSLCEILVLKSNGTFDEQIWSCPHFWRLELNSFCGVWGDDRFLIMRSDEQSLFIVNPSSPEENCQRIKHVFEPGWRFCGEAHDYVPSLTSVYPNRKNEELKKINVRPTFDIYPFRDVDDI
ncbi:F-box protein CPR1, partial [Morus notabilis]|uniref:F-box protein CPR1 n=1 Tax=Morus notabilis TaxID=981085 RepID=UPI000CED22E4